MLARGKHGLVRRELASLEASGDARVWSLSGVNELEAGRPRAAKVALERAIARHPFYAEAHWALGRLHTRRGNAVEGLRSLAKTSRSPDVMADCCLTLIDYWESLRA